MRLLRSSAGSSARTPTSRPLAAAGFVFLGKTKRQSSAPCRRRMPLATGRHGTRGHEPSPGGRAAARPPRWSRAWSRSARERRRRLDRIRRASADGRSQAVPRATSMGRTPARAGPGLDRARRRRSVREPACWMPSRLPAGRPLHAPPRASLREEGGHAADAPHRRPAAHPEGKLGPPVRHRGARDRAPPRVPRAPGRGAIPPPRRPRHRADPRAITV